MTLPSPGPVTRPTTAELDLLRRRDFLTFIERCFHELNPGTALQLMWYLQVVADRLEAVRRGRCRRLIINLPPRHLKSISASVAFPAWCLGHDPTLQIICASYAQDLADKHARDCRRVMTAGWYRRLFGARLSGPRPAAHELATARGGFRMATSVGGVITGRGGDILVIDDPLKPDEAVSTANRRAVNEWFDHTLYSRLNDQRTGAIVIIMQRLHEDDLVGHVRDREAWEVLRFPAIAEEDETFEADTLFGRQTYGRARGEPLHPAREPLDVLDRIKATIGAYNFAGQYQQSPAPLGGGLVKREWFKVYDPIRDWRSFGRRVQSWDTANTAGELSDYSVCTTWGIAGKDLYLLDVFRRRLEYPDLKRAVRAQAQRYQPSTIIIEDRASGTQLIQELAREGLHNIQRFKPMTDKVMRLHSQTATIENGFVYLPDRAPWLADYLLELTTFPRSKHDDQADATSQFLEWFKRPGPPVAQSGLSRFL